MNQIRPLRSRRKFLKVAGLLPGLPAVLPPALAAPQSTGPKTTPPTYTTTPAATSIVGDGIHDDTAAIQALLDSRRALVYLPAPPKHYLIGKPLRIYSNQTLQLDRFAMIRLKDRSDCLMITNDDHERGNENIALVGGVWDMHNEGQSLCEYQMTRNWKGSYDPARYLGVLMRFNRVKRLTLRSLTLKDPVTFSTQLGNLTEFTIEDITFDHNLKRTNMDGIHVHGNSRHGRITNLKGATNDDSIALNADDGGIFEMSRGAIEDLAVDGVWAKDGYTAVRLLSAGSPLRRIRLANIFGTYRFNAVSFTNHKVHPGSESVFEDISIRGLFCGKSGLGMNADASKPGNSNLALIWIDAPAVVSGFTIADLHRTETTWPAPTIFVEPGATITSLQLAQAAILNRTPGPLDLLVNRGSIGHLILSQIRMEASEGPVRGAVVRNSGKIQDRSFQQVSAVNAAVETVDKPDAR
jgi:hypothetical protein